MKLKQFKVLLEGINFMCGWKCVHVCIRIRFGWEWQKSPNTDLKKTEIYLTLMINSKGKEVQGLVPWFQTSRLLASCFSVMDLASLLKVISYMILQPAGRRKGKWKVVPPFFNISYSPLHLIIQNLGHIGTPTFNGGWDM